MNKMAKGKHQRNIESRLESFIRQDEEGFFYIPICNYEQHVGTIKDENLCAERLCNHYERYYLKTKNRREAKSNE